jgi:hypothetical protein
VDQVISRSAVLTVTNGGAYHLPATQIVGGHYSAVRFTSDPLVLYAMTYANGNNAQVTKSLDGGASWNVLPNDPFPYDDKWSIWADPNRTDRVIISGYSDIWVSTNGGTSFTNAGTPGIPAGELISSFAGAKSGGKMRFFALTGAASSIYPMSYPGGDYYGFIRGIYSLEDGAGSWTARMTGIDPANDYVQYLAMALNDVNTVYAAGSDGRTGSPEVMLTTDAGAHWSSSFKAGGNQNILTGWSGEGGDRGWGFGEVVYGIAVAPLDSTRAYITDMGFAHCTSDQGVTWRQAYTYAGDQHPAGSTAIAAKTYHSIGLENTSCY